MIKKIIAVSALGLAIPAQAAIVLSYQPSGATLPAGFTVIQNFDALAPGSSLGANAAVFSGSVGGIAARPAVGSSGNFGAVTTGGSYSINFAPASGFSFQLGSLDTYNTLTLAFANGAPITYIGGQIVNDLIFPSGDQISGETNGRITYVGTAGELITGATFSSAGNSFEFDNLATVLAVPEPKTWAIMLAGFVIVGTSMRRRRGVRVSLS
jgi:hypothetical protein